MCVASWRCTCFCVVLCVIFVRVILNGGLKLDISTLFTTFFFKHFFNLFYIRGCKLPVTPEWRLYSVPTASYKMQIAEVRAVQSTVMLCARCAIA